MHEETSRASLSMMIPRDQTVSSWYTCPLLKTKPHIVYRRQDTDIVGFWWLASRGSFWPRPPQRRLAAQAISVGEPLFGICPGSGLRKPARRGSRGQDARGGSPRWARPTRWRPARPCPMMGGFPVGRTVRGSMSDGRPREPQDVRRSRAPYLYPTEPDAEYPRTSGPGRVPLSPDNPQRNPGPAPRPERAPAWGDSPPPRSGRRGGPGPRRGGSPPGAPRRGGGGGEVLSRGGVALRRPLPAGGGWASVGRGLGRFLSGGGWASVGRGLGRFLSGGGWASVGRGLGR